MDILATFQLPGSNKLHRVIVECKDEEKNRAQNQVIMQFKGLLTTARKADIADSVEIITRVPWSDQAKGFAYESGIELLTYNEKLSQLIDFKPYLKNLVEKHEKGSAYRPSEPPLGKYYVYQCGETLGKNKKRIHVIDDYINKWLSSDENYRHLAILGGYGTGKTSLCQKLTHDLAKSYLDNPGSTRIPILFNLREFTKNLKIESLVTSFLDEECGVGNPRFKLFRAMNEAGILLLIFDGFDEMAVRVDRDTLEMNLQEIERLAISSNSKIIITSRFEYFVCKEEEEICLNPKKDILSSREINYKALKIIPWSDDQISEFLKKRVPLIKEEEKKPWTYYYDKINEISGLSDLSRRPVLLELIVRTLPRLISDKKPINLSNIYETYLKGEIKRQKIRKQRQLLLSEDTRFLLLQKLALNFYENNLMTFTFQDALKYIEGTVPTPKNEIEAYTRDFLSCSFLLREGDDYTFSHKSIMEFFVAKVLAKEIKESKQINEEESGFFGKRRLEPVIIEFLTKFQPDEGRLKILLESSNSIDAQKSEYLAGNAATLLCKLNRRALIGR